MIRVRNSHRSRWFSLPVLVVILAGFLVIQDSAQAWATAISPTTVIFSSGNNGVNVSGSTVDDTNGRWALTYSRNNSIGEMEVCAKLKDGNWYNQWQAGNSSAFSTITINPTTPAPASASNSTIEIRVWSSPSSNTNTGIMPSCAGNGGGAGPTVTLSNGQIASLNYAASWSIVTGTTCSDGTFSQTKASYVGGLLWVSWRWVGANFTGQTYPSFYVANANETNTYLVGAAYTSGGAIGSADPSGYYMYGKTPVSVANPGATVSLYFMRDNGTALCKQSIPVQTTQQITPGAAQPPDGYGGGADPDTGSDCSGFDIFCRFKAALKWAILPGPTSMNAWQSFITTANTHAPMSLVVSGIPYLSDLYGFISHTQPCYDGPDNFAHSSTDCKQPWAVHADGTTITNVDFLGGAGDAMQGEGQFANHNIGPIFYKVLEAGIWVPFLLWVFNRIGVSFGSKPTD